MTPPRDQDDAEAAKNPAQTLAPQSFEGDYRPSSETLPLPGSIKVDPLQTEFLMRLANALNTTLDLQTLLHRTADLCARSLTTRFSPSCCSTSGPTTCACGFKSDIRPRPSGCGSASVKASSAGQ